MHENYFKLLTFVVFAFCGCRNTASVQSNMPTDTPSDNAEITVETTNPQSCLPYFRKEQADKDGDSVSALQPVTVRFRTPQIGPDFLLQCELATLTTTNSEVPAPLLGGFDSYRYRLFMTSQPCSLQEAVEHARAICSRFRLSDEKLTSWYSKREYEDVLTQTVLQTGDVTRGNLSVEVRRSFNERNPWRVTCSLHFNREPKKGQGTN
jgi:hypothetical protein